MRTDATIDRQEVKLPNVSHIGYNRWNACAGDIVVWNDDGIRRVCRVVGRIAYAPALGETPEIRNYLFLAVLNNTFSSTYIRWVNPAEIIECYKSEDYAQLMLNNINRFLSKEFIKQTPLDIAAELER